MMSDQQKAAFFDRDGVINDDTGHYYIYKPTDFKLNQGVVETFKMVQELGYKIIVITNQGGVSRGTYSRKDVELVHLKMRELLLEHHVTIDEIYYCPHHSKFENCLCRKPQPLSIEKAMARFNIDPSLSFLVGDNDKDVEAAHNAGVKGYKIETNSNMFQLVKGIVNGR